jgi:soluble cytochrome b562
MKKSRLHVTIALLATLILFSLATAVSADEFSVKEYGEFHEVLHPLQHEALPAKDFKRIRANAADLVKRGQAIVKVGVPQGTSDNQVEEFRRELKTFTGALDKFSSHSQSGTDEQLEASFSAVHDSFEMLAGMLPRK